MSAWRWEDPWWRRRLVMEERIVGVTGGVGWLGVAAKAAVKAVAAEEEAALGNGFEYHKPAQPGMYRLAAAAIASGW